MREHEIVRQVLQAKKDPDRLDQLLGLYQPFIQSETRKFMSNKNVFSIEDELSIAMFAFYQAVMNYEQSRGSFLGFAAAIIRNQLIDYSRKENRHQNVLSLDESQDDDNELTRLDYLSDAVSPIDEKAQRDATWEEIQEFQAVLKSYDLDLSAVADQCPKQDRTLFSCHQALQYAKEHPELLMKLVETKKLPIAQLALGSGVERKTLERHRKYVMAIMLAYTNGFELIRNHLRQMKPRKVRKIG